MAILLTNDDGIDAPGLAALEEALAGLDDLYISAPAQNQSGVGMAISVGRALRVKRYPDSKFGSRRAAVAGTPADSVKYGLEHLLGGRKPRLVVSGINHGPNLGRNVRCSGTVGAACEAATSGVPSVAVSTGHEIPPVWEGAKHYARRVAEMALRMADSGRHGAFLLNLNVPGLPADRIRGLVTAPHGLGGFQDFLRVQPDGETYQMDGAWVEMEPDSNCDAAAFLADYAVVTPMQFDMTHHGLLAALREDWRGQLADCEERIKN